MSLLPRDLAPELRLVSLSAQSSQLNSGNFSHDEGERQKKQQKMVWSNYRVFLQGRTAKRTYPIPDTFKLMHVVDRSNQAIKGQYQWFNFPILSYSGHQLCEVAVKIIQSYGFEEFCDIKTLQKLVQQICLSYNSVSYHNFSHAFSLMHMFYQLTKLDSNFRKICTNQQICYALIAALGHDLNHPGTNNGYETKMKSQLAIQANYQAILQKMHIKQFFNILKTHNLDIFKNCTNPAKTKQLIINAILATDVTQHFKNLQKLKILLSTHNSTNNPSNLHHQLTVDQKQFCLEQVFHACDIGNPCLEFQEYINWASLLSYQFNSQTLMEGENKLEVTEMLRYKSLKGFYQGQIGFINYLAFPLWKELANTWTGFQLLVENIQTNLKLLQLKAQNQKQ